ncbi:unnamed protein product, partial [Rotaria magnacalcarata]
NRQLFGTLVGCINSFAGTRDYLKAIDQLDSTSVNKHNEFLLFDAFDFVINNDLYTEKFRTKFCRDFRLSKYKIILKEILPSAT